MGEVLEFPASRVHEGAFPLAILTDNLNDVFGSTRKWFAKRKRSYVTDRAGLAVLMIERIAQDGVRIMLRAWCEDKATYDNVFVCFARFTAKGVDWLFDPKGISLPLAERKRLCGFLDTAKQGLEAGTLVRIVN